MALSHFDTLYRQQYSDLWPAIRIALLSKQKYGALINNFCQNEDFLNFLTEQDATDFVHDGAIRLRQACQHIDESKDDSTVVIDMNTDVKHNKQDEEFYISPNTEYIGRDAARISSHLSHKTEFETYHIPNKINTIKYDFNVSPHLKCFIHGNEQRFTNPYYDAAIGTMAYYIMDASSILPVIALDIQPDDVILDMCAAPGGKALAMLQTMYVGGLVVNDPAYSRRLSLKSVISSYMPKSMITGDMLRITKYDGTKWSQLESNVYDKVLVDVPCTTDRHVLHNNDNNIFSRSRNKERQSLPSLQSELL
uniref:NOL1/NOP2/Sun domain family member 4 n=1 Tax=Saccoglossus kowalevskii TaxID=10224 RepID=A0ABM0MYG8_SACKO